MNTPEPTITLTRKQLLALGMSETVVDLLRFSDAQSNKPADQIQQKPPKNAAKAITSNPITTSNRSATKLNQMEEMIKIKNMLEQLINAQEEPDVKLNDLPELPFELILSYLSLEDRIKARAVSRRWHRTIDSFRVKRLCYSQLQSDRVLGKSRLISGEFVQNFVHSSGFTSFFQTFGESILSTLKHLRLCDLRLTASNGAFVFASTLNSFDRLEMLDIVRVDYPPAGPDKKMELRLNLPMLADIHLRQLNGIDKLALDSLNLQRIKLFECAPLRMHLVHAETITSLITDKIDHTPAKRLKNLQYLEMSCYQKIDSTFLDSLVQLKEIRTHDHKSLKTIFEQKQRYGRLDLKIYLYGFLLDGPTDPAIQSTARFYDDRIFKYLAENPSRVADQTAFYWEIHYLTFEMIPGLDANLLNKFTDLERIVFEEEPQVQDIERFLAILKNSENIIKLEFLNDYSQALFDRLPDHCSVQELVLCNLEHAESGTLPDLGFVFRLRDLIDLSIYWPIDTHFIRKAFKELQFLSSFNFMYLDKDVRIETFHPNYFEVSVDKKSAKASDLDGAIQFVVDKAIEAKEEAVEEE